MIFARAVVRVRVRYVVRRLGICATVGDEDAAAVVMVGERIEVEGVRCSSAAVDGEHAAVVVSSRHGLVVDCVRVGATIDGVRARAILVVVGGLRVFAGGRELPT